MLCMASLLSSIEKIPLLSESLSIVMQKKSNMSFVKVFEQDPADAERLIARGSNPARQPGTCPQPSQSPHVHDLDVSR